MARKAATPAQTATPTAIAQAGRVPHAGPHAAQAPATALTQAAAVLQSMQAALATPAPAPAPTVALRGGLAIQAVKLTGKPYRVGATHNAQWWQQVQAGVAAGGGQATVQALVAAKVPAIFIGYVVRRGYAQAA